MLANGIAKGLPVEELANRKQGSWKVLCDRVEMRRGISHMVCHRPRHGCTTDGTIDRSIDYVVGAIWGGGIVLHYMCVVARWCYETAIE